MREGRLRRMRAAYPEYGAKNQQAWLSQMDADYNRKYQSELTRLGYRGIVQGAKDAQGHARRDERVQAQAAPQRVEDGPGGDEPQAGDRYRVVGTAPTDDQDIVVRAIKDDIDQTLGFVRTPARQPWDLSASAEMAREALRDIERIRQRRRSS